MYFYTLIKNNRGMTLKQLIKLEDKAKEVWVISPTLHYDVENKDFNELVSVNLNQKTKYRYIVPANQVVEKNIKIYKKQYKLSNTELKEYFLFLPESDFVPFVQEIAIYNPNGKCVACAAPALEDNDDVIRFNQTTSRAMAKAFNAIWRKYKRTTP
jgi:hypothetical protein